MATEKSVKELILALVSVLLTGSMLYYSLGLSGSYGFLLWFAPIPLMIISFYSGPRKAFFLAFAAYGIGIFSWHSYLKKLMPEFRVDFILFLQALIFACVIALSRKIVIRTRKWYSVFALPAIWAAVEFMISMYSHDGTFGNIAYTQSNYLYLVQIASVTGITGITFVILLFPSMVSVGWYLRQEKRQWMATIFVPSFLLVFVFLFGLIHLRRKLPDDLKVGISVIKEGLHNNSGRPDNSRDLSVAGFYANQADLLARQGTGIILLPERALSLEKGSDSSIISMISKTARTYHCWIASGYTNLENQVKRNSAFVMDSSGRRILDYNKVDLVSGFENVFMPGKNIGIFDYRGVSAGVAICKDLDFPDYIRKYGKNHISFLLVPAWDFGDDAWLHSRMAIMRSIENGFSLVRAARYGRITISDPEGRIKGEVSCTDGAGYNLVSYIPVVPLNTFYTRFGNWLGFFLVFISLILIILSVFKNRSVNNSQ